MPPRDPTIALLFERGDDAWQPDPDEADRVRGLLAAMGPVRYHLRADYLKLRAVKLAERASEVLLAKRRLRRILGE